MAKFDGIIIPGEVIESQKQALAKKRQISMVVGGDEEEKDVGSNFFKSVLNELNGPSSQMHRLAFDINPNQNNTYAGVYRERLRLLPPSIAKRIAIQDDLIAAIAQARSNHVSAFGRPRPTRFDNGFVIEPKRTTLEAIDKLPEDQKVVQKEELRRRIAEATKLILNCGHTTGWADQERVSFAQYLALSARNIVILGMMATEVIWRDEGGKKKFHSFRVIDSGTVYRATPHSKQAKSVRENALKQLEAIKNEKLIPERLVRNEYAWIQVIDGKPVQAFTPEECLVYNFYAVPDIEMDGYPVTPLDTVLSAVLTHINITTHNKLYFQHGRAAKGMLVINSDDSDERVLRSVKQHFNASVNSAANSWRTPIFSIGQNDKVSFQTLDSTQRDMEFQYLMDMNVRVVLSAFMMSPEELPGWSYLSRGTASQALSESNSEYKLQAARDLGIRPLLRGIEDFLNASIFPLIDPVLSDLAVIRFMGLEAETPEKESIRMQQDMKVHLTIDEILEKVDKHAIGRRWGGAFLFNPDYQAILDKYFLVGSIKEEFFGHEGASQDAQWQYPRDSFWFQKQQLMQAELQMQQAQQAQEQQMALAQQAQEQGLDPNAPPGAEQQPQQEGEEAPQEGMAGAIDQAQGAVMGKALKKSLKTRKKPTKKG